MQQPVAQRGGTLVIGVPLIMNRRPRAGGQVRGPSWAVFLAWSSPFR